MLSTGLGSTAWLKSIVTGSVGIAKAVGHGQGDGYEPMPRDTDRLIFAVREPFASRASQTSLLYGEIDFMFNGTVATQLCADDFAAATTVIGGAHLSPLGTNRNCTRFRRRGRGTYGYIADTTCQGCDSRNGCHCIGWSSWCGQPYGVHTSGGPKTIAQRVSAGDMFQTQFIKIFYCILLFLFFD